ncbi:hypothetical protein BRADI_1g58615v3 [Brachypodium distachyon]|uniref:F-box associated domain-containing protein n=1 Tax=Brachypodium distachyon TaxID=15368 RepID=A0A2K2DSA4_BRADI|nr:hypothetical protein BRADI_1g58615v3 [Brachypodium distachyon]
MNSSTRSSSASRQTSPALLVRLSILSKSWDRLLSDPAFRHRYRKLHQKAPTLGFHYSEYSTEIVTSFIPATGFCPPCIPNYKLADFAVSDCRHGHVLGRAFLFDFVHMQLMVWNPMTGHHTHLKSFDDSLICMGEAVLCPVESCDHATCHDFHVICIGINKEEGTTTAYVYSSQSDEWSTPTPRLQLDWCNIQMHNVIVGSALYFLLTYGPHGTQILNLYLWTMKSGPDGSVAWTQDRVIDLAALLPVGDLVSEVRLIGSMKGTDIIFASTALSIYSIDLKLLKSKKLREQQNCRDIFPFMSFYNPLGSCRGRL